MAVDHAADNRVGGKQEKDHTHEHDRAHEGVGVHDPLQTAVPDVKADDYSDEQNAGAE